MRKLLLVCCICTLGIWTIQAQDLASIETVNLKKELKEITNSKVEGYYIDKDGKKIEGLISLKVSSTQPGKALKVDAIQYNADKDQKGIKLTPKEIIEFKQGANGVVYKKAYIKAKHKAKDKGVFVKVYMDGEIAAMYYSYELPVNFTIEDSKPYPSSFLLKYKENDLVEGKYNLIGSHKGAFKKAFGECAKFNEEVEKNKDFLSISNTANMINFVNENCK